MGWVGGLMYLQESIRTIDVGVRYLTGLSRIFIPHDWHFDNCAGNGVILQVSVSFANRRRTGRVSISIVFGYVAIKIVSRFVKRRGKKRDLVSVNRDVRINIANKYGVSEKSVRGRKEKTKIKTTAVMSSSSSSYTSNYYCCTRRVHTTWLRCNVLGLLHTSSLSEYFYVKFKKKKNVRCKNRTAAVATKTVLYACFGRCFEGKMSRALENSLQRED